MVGSNISNHYKYFRELALHMYYLYAMPELALDIYITFYFFPKSVDIYPLDELPNFILGILVYHV